MEKELEWPPKGIMIKLNPYHNRWEEAAFSALKMQEEIEILRVGRNVVN